MAGGRPRHPFRGGSEDTVHWCYSIYYLFIYCILPGAMLDQTSDRFLTAQNSYPPAAAASAVEYLSVWLVCCDTVDIDACCRIHFFRCNIRCPISSKSNLATNRSNEKDIYIKHTYGLFLWCPSSYVSITARLPVGILSD